MFKKKVEFKGSSVVGGKDMKKLKKDVSQCLGISEEAAGELFPHKVEICLKKVAQGGSKMQVYFAGDVPILVDEGRGRLFPTAMGLWAAPDLLPFFVVAQPVSKFVCGGADLMLPGVRGISHESFSEGSLAAVKVQGNPLPFAVGIVLFDPAKASAAEGRVLQLLQTYRDGLWEAGGEPRPNAGYGDDQVFPTEAVGSQAGAQGDGDGGAAEKGTGMEEDGAAGQDGDLQAVQGGALGAAL